MNINDAGTVGSLAKEVGNYLIGRAWDPSLLIDHWAIYFVQLWWQAMVIGMYHVACNCKMVHMWPYLANGKSSPMSQI